MTDCPRCGCLDHHDVTTLDQAQQHLMCAECGSLWLAVPFWPAPIIGRMQGPSVPTPAEILEGALPPSVRLLL